MNEEQLVDVLTMDALKRCFAKWGVEGTEDKIKEICPTPEMRDVMLRNYNRLVRG